MVVMVAIVAMVTMVAMVAMVTVVAWASNTAYRGTGAGCRELLHVCHQTFT